MKLFVSAIFVCFVFMSCTSKSIKGVWFSEKYGKIDIGDSIITRQDGTISDYEYLQSDSMLKIMNNATGEFALQKVTFIHNDTIILYDWITGNDTCYRMSE